MFLLKTSHYAIKMFDIMHTPGLLGLVKKSDIDCADKYSLNELSDLIGFGYDLSDTQDGLKCWRMEVIFCGNIFS